MNVVWDAPSPRSGVAVSRFLLSGWELSGILTAQSGVPFTLTITGDRAGTGSAQGGQRPNFKPGAGCSSPQSGINPGNIANYVNVSCFSFPALGE